MKKVLRPLLMFTFLLSAIIPKKIFAQDKLDIITMLNGEKKSGKVVSVNNNVVKFTYKGETAEYEINKSDISKIEFASGRTENFGAANTSQPTPAPTTSPSNNTQNASTTTTPEQRRNKIAVLPFEIESNDRNLATESLSKQIQSSCVSALRDQSPLQTIQDPMVTNNLLTKNNITGIDFSQHSPKEWAEMLGVEYVILGTYSIENKGSSTYGSGVATYDSKTKDDKTKGTAYGSNNSYTTTNYSTRVSMSIYNDGGNQVFNDSRSPAFGSVDSYKSALKTLAKRAPFGKK